jgi:hypothetical protein
MPATQFSVSRFASNSKNNSQWQVTYSSSVLVPITPRCRLTAWERIPPNCQPSVPKLPKLENRSLGLALNHPTSRLFVVEATTIKTTQETVAFMNSLAHSWRDILKLLVRLPKRPLSSTYYHCSPGGWTFLQERKGYMVRSWGSLRARQGELYTP